MWKAIKRFFRSEETQHRANYRKNRDSGVKKKVEAQLLTHKYLDPFEMAQRSGVTPKQSISALSYLYHTKRAERVRSIEHIPLDHGEGVIRERRCYKYRRITKENCGHAGTRDQGADLMS